MLDLTAVPFVDAHMHPPLRTQPATLEARPALTHPGLEQRGWPVRARRARRRGLPPLARPRARRALESGELSASVAEDAARMSMSGNAHARYW